MENGLIAKILITGASGFIGSHVLQTLMSIQHQDLEIVAACRNPDDLLTSYKGEVRAGDLRDPDYLDRLLVNIDIICHTAGWSSYTTNKNDSTQLYLEPTVELINHAIEWRVSRFVNLSSVAAATLSDRQDPLSAGKPRRYWPMMNCLIAVEDYMRAHAQIGCSMINLRLGIYSGQRMNTGLLPVLVNRLSTNRMSIPGGRYGHFPVVDGQDIGQAFVRAALAPVLEQYESFNITGPDHPTTSEVIAWLRQQESGHKKTIGLPARISHYHAWFQEYLKTSQQQSLFTRSLADMLANPMISNDLAIKKLGYDPKISWQASLHNLLEDLHKQNPGTSLHTTVKPLSLIK